MSGQLHGLGVATDLFGLSRLSPPVARVSPHNGCQDSLITHAASTQGWVLPRQP